MRDEELAVLTGLWSRQPFSFQGTYYQITDATFAPGPMQQLRIPIWGAGQWPHPGPVRRAAQWDGVCPNTLDRPVTPEEYQAIQARIRQYRASAAPFDVVHMQVVETPGVPPPPPTWRRMPRPESPGGWPISMRPALCPTSSTISGTGRRTRGGSSRLA